MISISPETALELPVDELALMVLGDLIVSREDREFTYLYRYTSDTIHGWSTQPIAITAIGEAFSWLWSNNLIAHNTIHDGNNSFFITRLGRSASKIGLKGLRSYKRLQDNLHPLLANTARKQFMIGEYESAIFSSMKTVEVRVRKLSKFGNDVYGDDLMKKAFNKEGPLCDKSAPGGEQVGMMMLFAGAYSVLRNPSGHREVEFDDITEASEAIMTASMLQRILDRIELRINSDPTT